MMAFRLHRLVAFALLAGAGWSVAEDAPAEDPPVSVIGEAIAVEVVGEAEAVVEGKRPWLGVHLEMNQPQADDEDADAQPLPGAGFISIFAGGPAQKAGLRQEDRVLRFEGKEIRDMAGLRAALGATKPGQKVSVLVLREGREVELGVVMGTMPPEPELQRLHQQINGDPGKARRVRFRSVSARPAGIAAPDRVALSDGNSLAGRVKSLTAAELVLVLESGAEVALDPAQVASARMGADAKPQRLPVAVLLRKGGWLTASQIGFDGDVFTLTLEDGGPLVLRRSEVAEVSLSDAGTPAIYRGPNPGDGWSGFPAGDWALREGAWQNIQPNQNGALARKFAELPGAMELSFDASIPPDRFCSLNLYAFRSGQIEIQSSPGTIQIPLGPGPPNPMQCGGDTTRALAPALPVKDWKPPAGKPVRYTVLSDRQKGTLILLVDGVVWNRFETDQVAAEDLPRAGRVIQFSGMQKLKIANITLRPWIGPAPKRAPGAGGDWIAAGDGEGAAGEIVKITPGEVTLADGKTVSRTQPVFLRLKTAQPAGPATPAGAGGVWVETKNGSAFAAESVALVQGSLVARSAFAPEYKLPMEALRSLDFRRAGEKPGNRLAETDVLTLRDGRRVTGRLVPPTRDGRLFWKIAAARQPLDFAVKDTASICLAASAAPVAVPRSVVRLRNGDWLPADVLGSDAGALQIRTPFSERLTVSRASIQSIYAPSAAALVADGATGRKRWKETDLTRPQGQVDAEMVPPLYAYQDGGYSVKGSPTRQLGSEGIFLPLPEAAGTLSVEFNVTTPQAFLTFQLMDRKGRTAFSLWGNRNELQMSGLNGDDLKFSPLGKGTLRDGNTRVQLVIDPGARLIRLAFNGELAGTCQWKRGVPWVEFASVLLLPAGYGNGDRLFRVSEVWVAPWRGSFAATPPAPENQVWLSLANGDEATGALLRLDGETAEIDTASVGRLSLPVAHLRALEIHAPAEPAAPACRVRLYDRGLLSASALRITEKSVVLSTELGELDVPLTQVREIVFAPTL